MKKIIYLSFVFILWGFYKLYGDPRASWYVKSLNRPDAVGEVIIYGFAGLVIFLMMMRRISLNKPPIPHIVLSGSFGLTFLLYILALITSTYSFFPMYTAFKAIQYLIAILIIAFILDEQKGNINYAKAINVVIYFAVINFFWVAISYFIAPNLVGVQISDGSYRLLGGMPFKRDYGFIPFCVAIFSLCKNLTTPNSRKRKYYFMLFVISIVYIGLYRTRGIIIITLVATLLVLYLLKKYDVKRLGYISILIIVLFLADHYLNLLSFALRLNLEELGSIGTRRIITLKYFIEEMPNVPFFGYGFLCTPFIAREAQSYIPLVILNTHNAFLETFYNLGYIGILLLFIIIFKVLKEFYLLLKTEKSGKSRELLTEMAAITLGIFMIFSTGLGFMGSINFSIIYLITIMGTLQLMRHKRNVCNPSRGNE